MTFQTGSYGVALDSSGNVYIADTDNCTIRRLSTNGTVTTIAGMPGSSGYRDGALTNNGTNFAEFNYPYGIAIDSSNNIFIADTHNNLIRKITGGTASTLAGDSAHLTAGTTDGTGTAARFDYPSALAVDSAGNLYVADTGNGLVRRVTPAGVVRTIAGKNGNGIFNDPFGIAVDKATNIYVADTYDQIVQKLTLSGTNWVAGTSPFAGQLYLSGDGDGLVANPNTALYQPWGVAVDNNTNVYVADSDNSNIRKISPAGILSTVAGPDESYGLVEGTGAQARFNQPNDVAVDAATNLYVADYVNNCIRKITPAGTVAILAGSPSGASGTNDGTNTSALFSNPSGLCLDAATNIYVADYGNSTVRKISPDASHSNWVTTTFAGQADVFGHIDGTGTSALFNGPYGVAADRMTNLYVTDNGNEVIRKITPARAVSTYAGTNAEFASPLGIAVDNSNNVYVADSGNNNVFIVPPSQKVTPFMTGASGILNYPWGVAVDAGGNVYVANSYANTILGITAGGKATNAIAGTANFVGGADGLGAAAQFDFPAGLAVDAAGNVYVADINNNTIRKGSPDTAQTDVLTLATSPSGFPLTLNGTTYSVTPQVFAEGANSAIAATALPENGYTFVNWTANGITASTASAYSFVLTTNVTLVANYLAGYAITASAQPANGGVTGGGGIFAANSTATLSATAYGGFQFTNWTVNGIAASTLTNYSFTVTSNETLVANFVVLPSPPLSIAQSASETVLSWPGSANVFVLESATSLAPSNWSVVTNKPAMQNGNFVLTNAWPQHAIFFRLHAP